MDCWSDFRNKYTVYHIIIVYIDTAKPWAHMSAFGLLFLRAAAFWRGATQSGCKLCINSIKLVENPWFLCHWRSAVLHLSLIYG